MISLQNPISDVVSWDTLMKHLSLPGVPEGEGEDVTMLFRLSLRPPPSDNPTPPMALPKPRLDRNSCFGDPY